MMYANNIFIIMFGGKLYLRIVLFLNFSRNGLKYWSIVYFFAGLCQWRSQEDFFIVRSHSLEWDFVYTYYPFPPYHPVSVLNTTSRVVFWHAPSEFFFFNFRHHNDILGLFLNFLLFKLCKTPLLIMSISILGVLITSLI